jgi:hypothetical protein
MIPFELADGGQPGPNGELLSCRIRELRAIAHSGLRRRSGYLGIKVRGYRDRALLPHRHDRHGSTAAGQLSNGVPSRPRAARWRDSKDCE